MLDRLLSIISFFFFNDTATTEIYTLSLHDALPIYGGARQARAGRPVGSGQQADLLQHRPDPLPLGRAEGGEGLGHGTAADAQQDRKSTRLNSSHANISYAVFCLKKKKKKI